MARNPSDHDTVPVGTHPYPADNSEHYAAAGRLQAREHISTSAVESTMKRATVLVAAIVCCTVRSVYAESVGGPGGAWPKSWPKELEPLRKQAWTWEHGLIMLPGYDIPFANRDESESAWPHILKLKSKGAPLTLLRGPQHLLVQPAKAAGVRILSRGGKAPEGGGPPSTVYEIQLVVDGDIVDLNRIPLPPDTPIIDKRFATGPE